MLEARILRVSHLAGRREVFDVRRAELEDVREVAVLRHREALHGQAAEVPGPGQLQEASVAGADDGRGPGGLVRAEMDDDVHVRRSDPLPVRDDCDRGGDRVSEEVHRWVHPGVDLERQVSAENRTSVDGRDVRAGWGGGGEGRQHGGDGDDGGAPHTSAPRTIIRRSAQRRKAPRISPGSCESISTGSVPKARKKLRSSACRASCSSRSRSASARVR